MLIAFCGVAQSGKSTAADYLVEKYGFNKHGFAAGVKEAVEALNPRVGSSNPNFDTEPLSTLLHEVGWDKAKQSPEIRGLLQRMGTEVGRGLFGENFWVDKLFADLEKKYGVYTDALLSLAIQSKVAIDDTRFANEALAVKKYGGLVIQVDRGTEPLNEHSSEVPLPEYLLDGTIKNTGSVEELYQGIETMLDFVGFKK